jgi:Icc-related predicted phosphoesterase
MKTKICAISDVHCKWNKIVIPEVDILISTGDYSFLGEAHVVRDFHKWMNKQPAKVKISLQGNHEKWVEKNFLEAKQIAEEACPGVHFIDEGLIEVEGLKIWCSAITPYFCNWAWNRHEEDIKEHWDKIPDGMDIIATHGPVWMILDSFPAFDNQLGEWIIRHVGCQELYARVLEVNPKVHICGHIHESYGTVVHNGIAFINASICNKDYKAVNAPIVFEI